MSTPRAVETDEGMLIYSPLDGTMLIPFDAIPDLLVTGAQILQSRGRVNERL